MMKLKRCVLWTIVTTAILILTMGTAYSDSINLASDGKVPGKPFELLQQQIDNLQQQIDNIPGLGPTRFTDMHNGAIRDNETGLIWLKDASCISPTDWVSATSTADELADGFCELTDGSTAGDWRLPTSDEWVGFMSDVYDNPALVNRVGDAKWYDGDAFIGVVFDRNLRVAYWSSEEHSKNEYYQYAWVAYLHNGTMGGVLAKSTYNTFPLPGAYVWPVREEVAD